MDSSVVSFQACSRQQLGVQEHRSQMHDRLDGDCMVKMLESDLLCDVVLVTQGMEIRTHKFVLASASTYFYWLFTKDRKLGRLNRIILDHISHRTLSQIVNYLYRGQISISEENVTDLLSAACSLVLRDLQSACSHFLANNLTPGNCINFGIIARQCRCEDLYYQVEDMVREHISEIVNHEQFLPLSYQQVTDLLDNVNKSTTDQEILLDSALRWVQHDLEHRQKYVYELMKMVLFPLIPLERIIQRFHEEHWLQIDAGYGIFITGILDSCVLGRKAVLVRNPTQSPKVLVAVGTTKKGLLNIEMYDFQEKIWLKHPKALKLINHRLSALTITGSRIYCLDSHQLRYLNLNGIPTSSWLVHYQLLNGLKGLGMAVINNSIYIIGKDGTFPKTEAIAYKFDIPYKELKAIGLIPEVEADISLVALNDKLYTIGRTMYLPSITPMRCYNMGTNFWYEMPSMPSARSSAGIGTLDGILYVIGGRNYSVYRAVEIFNPDSNSWKKLPDINVARVKPGVIGANAQLYVVGGLGLHGEYLDSVEVYDSQSNVWAMLPSSLNTPMANVAVALVEKSDIQL